MASSLKILIADEKPRARQSLRAAVRTWLEAVDIREAETGSQALSRVEEWLPDVVLMDARMPEMDGVTATRLIKAQWPRVQVIVLSMYSEHREAALAAGADMFFVKAAPPEHLRRKLAAIAALADPAAESD